jgi:transposase-like protein
MLRRFPEHAVCDSHLDSYNEVSSINAGWIPDPKSEFKCDLCGKTMQHRDKSEHNSLHQLGFEAHGLKLRSDIEKNVENLRNAVHKRFKEHEDRLNTLRDLRMKLTHFGDNIEAGLEEEIRRDDPKTGENYDEHY